MISKDLWLHPKAEEAFRSGQFRECFSGILCPLILDERDPFIDKSSSFNVNVFIHNSDFQKQSNNRPIFDKNEMNLIYEFLQLPKESIAYAVFCKVKEQNLTPLIIKEDHLNYLIETEVKERSLEDVFSKRDLKAIYGSLRGFYKTTKPAFKKG